MSLNADNGARFLFVLRVGERREATNFEMQKRIRVDEKIPAGAVLTRLVCDFQLAAIG